MTDAPKADGGGLRYDEGKPRFDLMPPEALWALADLYRIGAQKYADRNWERGMSWMKCFGCLMRHSWRWLAGEEFDDETGVHHMIHAAWNCIAIFTYFQRRIGRDDRSVKASLDGLSVAPMKVDGKQHPKHAIKSGFCKPEDCSHPILCAQNGGCIDNVPSFCLEDKKPAPKEVKYAKPGCPLCPDERICVILGSCAIISGHGAS